MEAVKVLLYLLVFPGAIFLFAFSTFAEWFDRKVYARLQNRIGPLHTGSHGLLQPVADFFKLMAKEDIVPAAADKGIFNALPLISFASALAGFLMIPIFRAHLPFTSFPGDLIVILYLLSIPTIIYFLAGWHSTNYFAMLGSFRNLTQLFGYEVPLFLALLAPGMLAGVWQGGIWMPTNWQIAAVGRFYMTHAYLIPVNIIGFVVALIALQAKLERVPFDAPEAETEIVAGALTEYSGKKLALFRLTVDMELVAGSALIAAVFLGGFILQPVMLGSFDISPFLSFILFVLKTLFVVALLSLMRALMGRLRIDQTIAFSWRWLAPLSLVQILISVALKALVRF
ncbi:MAG TPA: complex I subunit 1 family protein [bacterium]|nr:complex I subunit 1 family protein [bacterium]